MLKREIKVNGRYTAKVSNQVAIVRITRVNPRGGWDGVNERTQRTVRIRTAAKLRGEAPPIDRGTKTPKPDDIVKATVVAANELAKSGALDEPEEYTLDEAIDDAIRFLGDFIYTGAESGMKEEIDRCIGRLSEHIAY